MRQVLLATLIAVAITPSAIVSSPTTYDGKSVTVTGKVSNYQTSSTPMGPVAGFQLCDSKCVVVIDKTDQSRSDGATVTVSGRFHVTFKGPRKTFNNAIVISR